MELANYVHESLNKYFSSLKYSGYKSYNEVNKLLILVFIEELLNGAMSKYITDEDYKIINNSMNCLYGSCMIPYPVYRNRISHVVDRALHKHRVTETYTLRLTESMDLRYES